MKKVNYAVDLTSSFIFKKTMYLLADYLTRLAMSAAAKKFFDGKAVKRIYHELKSVRYIRSDGGSYKNRMG